MLAYIKNVNTSLTENDYIVFRAENYPTLKKGMTLKEELDLIRVIQFKVLNDIKGNDPIPNGSPREPYQLYESRSGLCFDRSRLLDKAYQFAGFESRHVYILFKLNTPFYKAFFTKMHSSHAVTEVLTSRGWVYVDSNIPWIALTKAGNPVDSNHLWLTRGELLNSPYTDQDNYDL